MIALNIFQVDTEQHLHIPFTKILPTKANCLRWGIHSRIHLNIARKYLKIQLFRHSSHFVFKST